MLLSPQIELIVERVIQFFYLQRTKPSFAALVEQIQVDCQVAGLKAPDRKTIRRRVLALDEREVTKHRQGPKAAREKYDAVSRSPAVIEALKRVQIDHAPVDLIVVGERDRRPIGRPWLTLAIDVASRMVCGFHLSLMSPSTACNMESLFCMPVLSAPPLSLLSYGNKRTRFSDAHIVAGDRHRS